MFSYAGHNIYTVEELMDELRKFPPNYEVGFNGDGQRAAFSLVKVKADPQGYGIVDVYLKTSWTEENGYTFPLPPGVE